LNPAARNIPGSEVQSCDERSVVRVKRAREGSLVVVVGGICVERSDEQKVILEERRYIVLVVASP